MGCDIHMYREVKRNGEWVSADKWSTYPYTPEGEQPSQWIEFEDRAFTGRNYHLFGTLARGVREDHELSFELRGLPFDVTQKVAAEWERGGDHSATYLFLHELIDFRRFIEKRGIVIEGMKDKDELADLRASIESGNPDWNKIYPYCRSTNDPRQVDFSIEVPAAFYIGRSLDEIIASFDGIEGDNKRFVFWFDN